MLNRLGLRTRFLLATMALTTILLAGFVYAIEELLDVVEKEMQDQELERHLDRVATLYSRHPRISPPNANGLTGFFVPKGQTQGLPPVIAALNNNQIQEVHLTGYRYEVAIGRRDVGDTSVYLVLDLAPVESLESKLETLAWILGLAALVLAVVIAFWLSRIVIHPVQALAGHMSRIVPGLPRPPLRADTGDRELNIIAVSFEQVLERFDAFVAREQAFTEDASHELRTPLSIIMSASQLLEADSALSDKSRARLGRLKTAALQMHELVEALLFLSREDSGGETTHSVAELLQQSVTLIREVAERSQRTIKLDIEGDRSVKAPPGMVLCVINNLLRNAIEHSSNGPIEVRLEPSRLTVRDKGPGIAPEMATRIFERRLRGEDSRGHGLGLHLVKRICERLGWSIQVETGTDTGSLFILML